VVVRRKGNRVEKFIARQPIFDSSRATVAYELLFRSGTANFFSGLNVDLACTSTADNLFLFGLDRLTQGRRAFINCSRDFLIREYAALLPRDRVVIEILETVQMDREVIEACRRLKQTGYVIALDDFIDAPEWAPLVAIADIIKVDFLLSSPDEQERMARDYSRRNIRMLAEKVETYADFERARQYGYSYFQGYFFSRPEILTHHDIPAYKLSFVRVLQAANRPEIDEEEVATAIKSEASLSYRLLRYLNSPVFSLVTEVSSIPHALRLLGERGIRRWVSLVAIACMGDDKPQELLTLPLVRARFCELLAPLAGQKSAANDFFLMGLLSAIDAILDMKMEDILEEIAIRDEIRQALLGGHNAFRDIFDIVKLYEKGSWAEFEAACGRVGIPAEAGTELYMSSTDWALAMLSGEELTETKSA